MTPRESLLEDFDDIVEAYGQSRQETRRTLNKYAIGKWVPVSERLPDKPGPYMVRWSNKRPSNQHDVWFDADAYADTGGWSCINRYATITHWLDLSLPEVEG